MTSAVREYWDGVGVEWAASRRDGLWRRCSDAIHTLWLDDVARAIPAGRLLKTDLFDEAFGDGLTPWFEARGHDVVACDLAFATARGAARRPASVAGALAHAVAVAVAVADVRQLPFLQDTFDTVFSDSTLDHFDSEADIRASLVELCRVLRPGGTLLLTLDNPANPFVWLRNLQPGFWMRVGIVPYAVGATCSRRRLTQLLHQTGFDVTSADTIMHVPRVLLVPLCRLMARRGADAPGPQLLKWQRRFEGLGRLPTRDMTGHFVAVVARRRP